MQRKTAPFSCHGVPTKRRLDTLGSTMTLLIGVELHSLCLMIRLLMKAKMRVHQIFVELDARDMSSHSLLAPNKWSLSQLILGKNEDSQKIVKLEV